MYFCMYKGFQGISHDKMRQVKLDAYLAKSLSGFAVQMYVKNDVQMCVCDAQMSDRNDVRTCVCDVQMSDGNDVQVCIRDVQAYDMERKS